MHDWLAQVLEKGGDVEQCMKLLKKMRRLKKRLQKGRREKLRELEKSKIEKEIRLKEAKEVALNEGELTERAKFRPKLTLPKFNEGEEIEVFLRSFEKLATSYKWNESEWAVRLVPQLTGKANCQAL